MSTLRQYCHEIYRETVAKHPMDAELRRALKAHERVPRFLDNLEREFAKIPFHVTRETVAQAVKDLTLVFISAVQCSVNDRMLSDLAKLQIKKEIADKEAIKERADLLLAEGTEHVEIKNGTETHKSTVIVPAGIL